MSCLRSPGPSSLNAGAQGNGLHNHDLVGVGFDSDWLRAQRRSVLCHPLLPGSSRSQLFSRNDHLLDALVPSARAWPGHRFLIRSRTDRFLGWLSDGGLVARSSLALADRMALALYS